MIRIERGKEVSPGVWAYCIPSLGICGRSRQPLLDACRSIKSTGVDTSARLAGIYRKGRAEPDMVCPVDVGASYTVSDTDRGTRFAKYKPFDKSVFKEAAE